MSMAKVSATHHTGSSICLWYASLPRRCSTRPMAQQALHAAQHPAELSRRNVLSNMAAAALLMAGTAAGPAAASSAAVPAAAKDFVQTESGLRVQDVRSVQHCGRCAKLHQAADINCCAVLYRAGSGATPQQGDNVSIHWSGYTAGDSPIAAMAATHASEDKVCIRNLSHEACHALLPHALAAKRRTATLQYCCYCHQSSH